MSGRGTRRRRDFRRFDVDRRYRERRRRRRRGRRGRIGIVGGRGFDGRGSIGVGGDGASISENSTDRRRDSDLSWNHPSHVRFLLSVAEKAAVEELREEDGSVHFAAGKTEHERTEQSVEGEINELPRDGVRKVGTRGRGAIVDRSLTTLIVASRSDFQAVQRTEDSTHELDLAGGGHAVPVRQQATEHRTRGGPDGSRGVRREKRASVPSKTPEMHKLSPGRNGNQSVRRRESSSRSLGVVRRDNLVRSRDTIRVTPFEGCFQKEFSVVVSTKQLERNVRACTHTCTYTDT